MEDSVQAAAPHGSRFWLRTRPWPWIAILLALVLLVLAVPTSRRHWLRATGWALVGPNPHVRSADVIVVAIDVQGAGTLEAADLVHEGVSTRVAVFEDPPTESDREFIRRGLPYDDRAAISETQLHMLGVQNVERIPRSVSGSEQEGQILPSWCQRRGYHSAVLVVAADHSRRIGRIIRRATRDRPVTIAVLSSRYSNFNPDSWWTSRYGARTEIIEFEKLVLDVARHPFS
jgi:hypothetical protein